jgi:hypothetical protein
VLPRRQAGGIAAREAFDAKETAAYTADLDARVEEQGVLEAARAATRLREELREELPEEGFDASDNKGDDDYVHLDDDDLDEDDLADLSTDAEATKAVVKQRGLMALFETQRRNETIWGFMVAKRRMATNRLAAAQQSARQSTHYRNVVAREARATAKRRQEEDQARETAERASLRHNQYPFPPLPPTRTPSTTATRFMRTASAVARRPATMAELAHPPTVLAPPTWVPLTHTTSS